MLKSISFSNPVQCLLWVGLGLYSSGCGQATSSRGLGSRADVNVESIAPGNAGADARLDTGSKVPWVPLIDRSWTVVPGTTNLYVCTTIQLDEDLYITGFRANQPAGQS